MKNYEKIIDCIGEIENKRNENLGKYTSYGCGGNADYMFFPKSKEELYRIIETTDGENVFILGNGTNILISDEGYNGIVINTKYLDKIEVNANVIKAECGANLSQVIKEAELNSLTGLEFAVGVPASVGGATAMNCGCFNRSLSEYVSYVDCYNGIYNNEKCGFSYRNSNFSNKNAIYSVCFILNVGEYDIIEEKISKFNKLRTGKQPKGRSCGSVFRNDDYFAGKLIDEAGLKGYAVGGARISDKHANFILSDGKAKSSDIYALIKFVKKTVHEKTGIMMQEELKYVGEFNDTDV